MNVSSLLERQLADFGVSRETGGRLDVLVALLRKWSPRINLVSRTTLDDIWHRHILDSAQLWGIAPTHAQSWIDIGSGAGFPGLVVAAIAADNGRRLSMTLVESDSRKAAFLQTAARQMELDIDIRASRVESLKAVHYDVISARAVAPLVHLLALAEPFCGPGTICLFPKGASVASELTEASRTWHIRHRAHPSVTDRSAAVLELLEFSREPTQPS